MEVRNISSNRDNRGSVAEHCKNSTVEEHSESYDYDGCFVDDRTVLLRRQHQL